MSNPYQPPRTEPGEFGYDWDASDRLLMEAGLARRRAAPWFCRVMRRWNLPHRPPIYQSGIAICVTGLLTGFLTLIFGMMLHRLIDQIDWHEALIYSLWTSFGTVIGASIGTDLHHRSVRKRHQLPPWPEFLRKVERASITI